MFDSLYTIVACTLFVFFALVTAYASIQKRMNVRASMKYDELDSHAAGNFNMQFYQPKR